MHFAASTLPLALGIFAAIASAQSSDDIIALSSIVVNNKFTSGPIANPFLLKADHSTQLSIGGGATFCVHNDFFFENTHIALSDVVKGIVDTLCDSILANCRPGDVTIKGDTGLSCIVSVQPAGSGCKSSVQLSAEEGEDIGEAIKGAIEGAVETIIEGLNGK
ncbi:hypothetical protein MMC18_004442 [Xylographa bjoerkii]|nr:hypothetical protein [Xylographa bjoerkii]